MALTVIKPSGLDLSGNFTVTSVSATANVSAGNVKTDNLLYANGAPYQFGSGTPGGSNTQVQFNNANSFAGSANFTFNNTTNTLSVTNIVANGSGLTSLTGANIVGQVSNALIAGTVYTSAQPNITSVGTLTDLTSNGTVNFTNASNVSLGAIANVKLTGGTSGQYLTTDGSGNLSFSTLNITSSSISNGNSNVNIPSANGNINISSSGNANVVIVTGAGINVAGTVAATGNVTAPNIITGSGSGGSITGANLVSANYLTGTLTTAAQPNITSVGTLSNLTSNGNVNFTNASNVSLGAIGNVKVTGGSNGQYLTTDGSGNLSFTTLSVSPSSISNGNSNVNITAANGNVTISSAGNANVVVVTGTGVNVAGNITMSGSDSNFSGANYVIANYFTGTLTTANQSNITNLGNLTGLTVSNSSGIVNFSNTSNVTLGSVSNLRISGGSADYVLRTDGTGNLSWVAQTGGSGNVAVNNLVVDSFTGNGVQTTFVLSSTPANVNCVIVNYNGVILLKDAYTLSGANLTISSAPANGAYLEVTTIGIVSGGGGANITIRDEGNTLTTAVDSINFVGAGVTATNTGNAVTVTVSGGGGAAANVFYENDLTLSANYTITSGKSAMSTGPITIANGVSVTIPTGSKWVVL